MKRKNWVDWMKAIGMLTIIWGHSFPEYFSSFLYAFSVSSFFTISGYLAKHESSQRVFWSKLFHTLLIPYLIFSVLKAIQSVFSVDGVFTIGAIIAGFHTIGDITGCLKLWFVYTLMLLKFIFQYVGTTPRRRLGLAIFSIIGAIIYRNTIDDVAWAVGNALISMPFFLLGYSLKNSYLFLQCEKWLTTIVYWKSFIIIMASAIMTYILSFYNNEAWMYMGQYGDSLILFVLSSILGIFFLFAISCTLDKYKSVGCKLISIGSVAVLAYHQDINYPMLKWIRLQHWDALATDLMMLLASFITLLVFIPLIYLASRYFPLLIGGRKI